MLEMSDMCDINHRFGLCKKMAPRPADALVRVPPSTRP